MNTYHFVIGQPGDFFHIVAGIDADSPAEAVAKLKGLVPKEVDLAWQGHDEAGGFADIYVDRDAIGEHHIQRVDTPGPEQLAPTG